MGSLGEDDAKNGGLNSLTYHLLNGGKENQGNKQIIHVVNKKVKTDFNTIVQDGAKY